jgi:hypothetical protein
MMTLSSHERRYLLWAVERRTETSCRVLQDLVRPSELTVLLA